MTAKPHARLSHESNQHFTPPEYVEAAREALGGIDLDPASCELANRLVVRADRFFDEHANGLKHAWYAPSMGPCRVIKPSRVWLNPPGGRVDLAGRTVAAGGESSARRWWFKLMAEWAKGNVLSAVFLGFNAEILRSAQTGGGNLAQPLDFPMCFPSKRIRYLAPRLTLEELSSAAARGVGTPLLKAGLSPTHPSVIVYVPPLFPDLEAHEVAMAREEGVERFRAAFAKFGRVVVPA